MRSLVAANWKMYKTRAEAGTTARELANSIGGAPDGREVIIFAPFTTLDTVRDALNGTHSVFLGGQNLFPATEGAFTGEISPVMLLDCGCTWVLAGHSERRHILGESPDFVGKKVAFALEQGLSVMLCIGETLEERENGKLEAVLRLQLEKGLAGVPAESLGRVAIAYEPVWAIGTGRVASADDILSAHAMVRELLSAQLGSAANAIPILYGGSVKPGNAKSILALDNVNGLLVGGASLQAESFASIIRADQQV